MTYENQINKDFINQRKCNLIATGVENETTAVWQLLLENKTFKNMVKKEFDSNNHYLDSIKILSKYANNNLIQDRSKHPLKRVYCVKYTTDEIRTKTKGKQWLMKKE